MEDRLSYEISIPENLYPLAIPRLSLTTLAENAVKHGIAQNKTGGKVLINGAFRENGYCLSVVHPGIFGNGEGIGIRNLQERLRILYKGKAFFEIHSEDGMVKASLFIPQ
jgi:sensor histidine kinase YesM